MQHTGNQHAGRRSIAARLTWLAVIVGQSVGAPYVAADEEISSAPSDAIALEESKAMSWNMYDLLRDFVELNDIPQGPILLRDLGLSPAGEGSKNHKANTFRELLARYPTLQAVLIGDSGQHDTQLYATLAKEFPDRVIAVYIRDVDPDHESAFDAKVDAIINDQSGNGVPMLRGKDSDIFAAHMTKIGILPGDGGTQVAASVNRDERREGVAEL